MDMSESVAAQWFWKKKSDSTPGLKQHPTAALKNNY